MNDSNEKQPASARHAPLWRRFGWLVIIWSASVFTLTLIAFILRWLMGSVGLTAPE